MSKYFIATNYNEYYKQQRCLGFKKGKDIPTIDLISIGIVSEDDREYYVISKEFDIKAAWNKYNSVINENFNSSFWNGVEKKWNPMCIKEYWLRDNVLKPIFKELCLIDAKSTNVYLVGEDKLIPNDLKFTLKNFTKLINKYGKTNKQIANEVKEFCTVNEIAGNGILEQIEGFKDNTDRDIKFYGYYADYDWVVFAQLYGKMIDLPKGFPMYCRDIKQMVDDLATHLNPKGSKLTPTQWIELIKEHSDYPKQDNEHNALSDAIWNKELYDFLNKL